ncbi:MAG: biotin/lipoyl-binding protein [Actinomycetales bacterium]|nr:biotin/lipoyl-binding protein [Actinomycetales bacterium]
MSPTAPGRRPIGRLLVANRGEIALRVMRTARHLGIETVAVHSDPDTDAPHARYADRAVRLPGATSLETYLDAERIIAAALASGADAIHPGYGFLSENPAFARSVVDHGLTWVGPTPESIEAMALKVEAKRIAAEAQVPLVPGAELPESMDDADLQSTCASVGFPLLVKASAGGGGKGMRLVERGEDVVEAVAAARREAVSAFGDGTVFAERYLAGARHVEVQVMGDAHGTVVHLFERECSIQRRHQKIIEEAPSPGVTDRVRGLLHEAAVALAQRIAYVGAGTVEFLVAGEGGGQEFFFLEMNTRLQVEHPVTEAITGLDLVELQLLVAQGAPLPFGQADVTASGHAIEARLYAEDPAHGYLPATGRIHRFRPAPDLPLRVDAGVADGSTITAFYDPMLAKVIAHGATRAESARRLARGLAGLELHGPVTNRESLIATLRSSAFLAGATTTAFLDENPEVLSPQVDAADEGRHARALLLAVLEAERPDSRVPLGWRNVPGPSPVVALERRGGGGPLELSLAEAREDEVITARCRVTRYGDEAFVDDGLVSTAWRVLPRFADPTAEGTAHGAVTPVPGTITAVLVSVGDEVTAGQPLVILEAMKMEHRITADTDGVVARVLVEVGRSVDAHALVVEVDS